MNRYLLALTAAALLANPCLAGKGNGNGGGGNGGGDPPPPTLSFTMQRLGTLGGDSSEAGAMNALGDVAGTAQVSDGSWAPFVYSSKTGMLDLRDFLSAGDMAAFDWQTFGPTGMNSSGQICGGVIGESADGGLRNYAVRVSLPSTPDGTATIEVVDPAGSIWSRAHGINEAGDVTGLYQLASGASLAFVFVDGAGSGDIGHLGGGEAAGAAINDVAQVTGSSSTSAGETRAFRSTAGVPMENLGVIRSVNGLSTGNGSWGNAINVSGTVVGQSIAGTKKGTPVWHAFRESGNGMLDLGTLAGDEESSATSVSSDGTIVGWSRGGWVFRGFIRSDEFGMLELDSLISNPPAGATGIIRGTFLQINDANEICGSVNYADGTFEAFVLTLNN